jgi:hypothetical protein
VSLTQLVGHLHVKCKGRSSNIDTPTYSSLRGEILATRLSDKKKLSYVYVQMKLLILKAIIECLPNNTDFLSNILTILKDIIECLPKKKKILLNI